MAIFEVGLSLFLGPIAMTVLLVYLYGMIGRVNRAPQWLQMFASGVLLGSASAYAMHYPFALAEGFIVDMRNLFIGLAAAFSGPIGGLAAFAIGAFVRLEIGGFGASYGVAGMAVAATMGWVWYQFVAPRVGSLVMSLPLLGFIISAHLLVGLTMPVEISVPFMTEVAPFILVSNIIGAVVIGQLLEREKTLIARTDELAFAAQRDPLTHLMNRRGTEEAFAKLPTTSGHSEGRAMFYFDVDLFKDVNDEHGHLIGDKVLVEITNRVQNCLRPQDLFARIGGDEFLVVLPNISAKDAQIVSERCRAAVGSDPIKVGDLELPITISVGVHWLKRAANFTDQVADADDALYASKAAGRNRVTFTKTEVELATDVVPQPIYRTA